MIKGSLKDPELTVLINDYSFFSKSVLMDKALG